MSGDEVIQFFTQAAYLGMAVVSFSLFLLIAAFKGKGLVDWLLMLRDLMLSALTLKFFLRSTLGIQEPLELRLAQWVALAVVCILLFIALVREHLIYRRRYLKHKQDVNET